MNCCHHYFVSYGLKAPFLSFIRANVCAPSVGHFRASQFFFLSLSQYLEVLAVFSLSLRQTGSNFIFNRRLSLPLGLRICELQFTSCANI